MDEIDKVIALSNIEDFLRKEWGEASDSEINALEYLNLGSLIEALAAQYPEAFENEIGQALYNQYSFIAQKLFRPEDLIKAYDIFSSTLAFSRNVIESLENEE